MARGKTIEDFLIQCFNNGIDYDMHAGKNGKTVYSILAETPEYRKNSFINIWQSNRNKEIMGIDKKFSKTM